MTATFNRIRIFRWKAVLTFVATGGLAFVGAVSTSGDATTWQQWVIAAVTSVSAGAGAVVALLAQLEKQIESAPSEPTAP